MYTLRNGWTKRKMINAIMSGNQGVCSSKDDVSCFYRSRHNGDVNKCAVGCFIPDKLYSKSMEGKSVSGLIAEHPEIKNILPLSRHALDELQGIHDAFNGKPDDPRPALINWIKENVK